VDWRERYERAAARYAAGETRDPDERQLVQLANSAWAAGLSLLMAGEREGASQWLQKAAERYRESWEAGSATEAWGRPIGAMKALLIAGEDATDTAEWSLETCLGVRHLDMSVSPIARYAAALALLVLERDEEAGVVAAMLGEGFPDDVAAALAALASHDADTYRTAVAAIRTSFETREEFLEDVPVADTALALDALAVSRGLL
jgi:tetratricopeptide (TPR) repeat protein